MDNQKLEKIKTAVKDFMGEHNNGHGWSHTQRVYHNAVKIAQEEGADAETAGIAALLHDCDDYKFFGAEAEANLSNAKRIMAAAGVNVNQAQKIAEIIKHMGYSKALAGIRPQSTEGKIVSDADMLDAMGAQAILRTLQYTLKNGTGVVFDAKIWPTAEIDAKTYRQKNRKTDSFINHFFEKNLKLYGMLYTDSARKEGRKRHEFMANFLNEFFYEENEPDWIDYLEKFEKENFKKAA